MRIPDIQNAGAARGLLEAKRKRARTLIDGMIKTLISRGRTRDEAISDLKKQIDSRFYEHLDAAAGVPVMEDAKLTSRDSVETWIRRFKDSRNPRFAGKSPEQREKMARAAHYRAVQNMNPFASQGQSTTRESDELDELRIDNKHGWGAVPYNQNVDYRGLRVRVRPSTFLKLAHKLDRYYSADDIEKHIRADGAIGAPFLMVAIPQDWFEGDMSSPAEIYGHEGRNRMTAALRAEGDEPVETHLFFGSGLRNRDLKPEIVARLNDDVISQDGKLVGGPWFQPMPNGMEEAFKGTWHLPEIDRVTANVRDCFRRNNAYQALENVIDSKVTVNDSPELKSLFAANTNALAKLARDEIVHGDAEPSVLDELLSMIKHAGMSMPDERIADALYFSYKRDIVNSLRKAAGHGGMTDVIGTIRMLEEWGLSISIEEILDAEDNRDIIIRDLLIALKRGQDPEVRNVIEALRAEGHDWPEFGAMLQSMDAGKISEVAKVRISRDPNDLGAYVRDEGKPEPTVMIPVGQIDHVLEPDELHQTKPGASRRIAGMVRAITHGKHMPPILVRRYQDGYQVMDGHHRFKAYRLAGVGSIPARIVDPSNITGDIDESDSEHDAYLRQLMAYLKSYLLDKQYYGTFELIQEIASMDDVPYDLKPLLDQNKHGILSSMLRIIKSTETGQYLSPSTAGFDARSTLHGLRSLGVDWPELDAIESSFSQTKPRRKRVKGGKPGEEPVRESFDPIRYVKQARDAIAAGWIDSVLNSMVYGVRVGKVTPAEPIKELLDDNRDDIIRHLLVSLRSPELQSDKGYVSKIVGMLRKMGIEWQELSAIEQSLVDDLGENFADGKGPGRPGDSQRHGIPKGATMAQLRKAAKAPGRKGQLARWQINMRRGRAKANEAIAPHGGPEDELRMMKAGTKPATLMLDYHFDTLYRPLVDEMGWEVVRFNIGRDVHYVVAQQGERARAKRIAGLVSDANRAIAAGTKLSPEYHRELGTLLGYSQADIDHFIGKVYGDTVAAEEGMVSEADGNPNGAALTVFDMDETLFHTKARIYVVRDGKIIRRLSNQEYNTYQLKPGETFDYREFRDARFFHDTSVPIERMWRKAQNLLSNIGKRPGSRVIIVTARTDLDDRETFLDTFRKHGLDIDKVHVHRAGNLPVPAAAAKKAIIATYLNTGKFDSARLIDDAESNLRSFLELRGDYPGIRFSAYLVLPGGNMVKYES